MLHILWTVVILACSVWVAAAVVPGIKVKTFRDAIVVSIIFALVNWFFGWFLFVFIGIATIGLGFVFALLTRVVVSALLLLLTDKLTDRLTVQSFGWAFWGAVVISVMSFVLEKVLHAIPGLPGI